MVKVFQSQLGNDWNLLAKYRKGREFMPRALLSS